MDIARPRYLSIPPRLIAFALCAGLIFHHTLLFSKNIKQPRGTRNHLILGMGKNMDLPMRHFLLGIHHVSGTTPFTIGLQNDLYFKNRSHTLGNGGRYTQKELINGTHFILALTAMRNKSISLSIGVRTGAVFTSSKYVYKDPGLSQFLPDNRSSFNGCISMYYQIRFKLGSNAGLLAYTYQTAFSETRLRTIGLALSIRIKNENH